MARLIPNPVAEINDKIDGIVSKVETTLGRADQTLGNVSVTLTEVEGSLAGVEHVLTEVRDLLARLDTHLEVLELVPAMAAKLDEVHAAVTGAGPVVAAGEAKPKKKARS